MLELISYHVIYYNVIFNVKMFIPKYTLIFYISTIKREINTMHCNFKTMHVVYQPD